MGTVQQPNLTQHTSALRAGTLTKEIRESLGQVWRLGIIGPVAVLRPPATRRSLHRACIASAYSVGAEVCTYVSKQNRTPNSRCNCEMNYRYCSPSVTSPTDMMHLIKPPGSPCPYCSSPLSSTNSPSGLGSKSSSVGHPARDSSGRNSAV